MKIIDISKMPDFNSEVKNGTDSVSTNKIFIKEDHMDAFIIQNNKIEKIKVIEFEYPVCREHGAIKKVSPIGIWRCLACNEGCYQVE